jgi:hypothetical protein
MGIVANLVGSVFGDDAGSANGLRYAVCCACLFARGVVSPAIFPLRAAGPGLIQDDYERMIDTIPRGPAFARQTVVLLNEPFDLFGMCLPIVAMAKGEASPAHMYALYAGADPLAVVRTGPRSLEVRPERGWLARFTDRIFRDSPLRPGDTVDLAAMTARVESLTPDGRPRAVEFSFPTDLDDPSLLILSWGSHGFERVVAPRSGTPLGVAPAPLLLADFLRPHIRERAVEDDR